MKSLYPRTVARWRLKLIYLALAILLIFNAPAVFAGEELYRSLSAAGKNAESSLFMELYRNGQNQNWPAAKEVQFEGNLRFLDRDAAAGDKIPGIFLVRSLEGELYIVSIPSDDELKSITSSFGITGFDAGVSAEKISEEDIVRKADQCLHRAKEGGRNRVVADGIIR